MNVKTQVEALTALREQAKSDPAAEALLRQRAENGEAAAAFFMGTLFDPTIDRPKASPERTKQSIDWYRRAADQNIPIAQANLGLLLAHGNPPDYEQAYKWLDLASPKMPAAQRELALLYRYGHGVPLDVTKSMDLMRGAAERGDRFAQRIVGDAFDQGTDGLAVDKHEAVLWYQKAALQNDAPAQRQLAIHLQKGDGVGVDQEKARSWFQRAAANGDGFSRAQIYGGARAASPLAGLTPGPAPVGTAPGASTDPAPPR